MVMGTGLNFITKGTPLGISLFVLYENPYHSQFFWNFR